MMTPDSAPNEDLPAELRDALGTPFPDDRETLGRFVTHDRPDVRRAAASGLADLAAAHPGDSRCVSDCAQVLESDDPEVRVAGAVGLADVGAADASALEPVSGRLFDAVGDEYPLVRFHAIRAVSTTGNTPVADSSRLVDALSTALDDEWGVTREAAATALAGIAESTPETAQRAIPSLLDLLTDESTPDGSKIPSFDDGEGDSPPAEAFEREHDQARELADSIREMAALTVGRIATARPTAVSEHRDAVVSLLADPNDGVQAAAAEIVAGSAAANPESWSTAIEPLAELLADREDPTLLAPAAHALAALASQYAHEVTDAVTPIPDSIRTLLAADENRRATAAGLLSYVAERRPDEVAPYLDTLVELLSDSSEAARGNAIWALGYLGDDRAIEALERARKREPNPAIRATIDDALAVSRTRE